jgi:hypothetical protein
MDDFDVTVKRGRAPGDQYFDAHAVDTKTSTELVVGSSHPMDSQEARDELRRLLEWFYYEKDKQATNRLEMATDHDFYDNLQWDPEDAQALRDRGQMPLVYNEVAPMCDWLIGTERRTRVDWKVLPRTEDDVPMADVKTKVMKFIADVNKVVFLRSRAFSDAIKGGLGWIDDGARDDPTKDVLYSKYEDWRNVLHDSDSYELDLSDARYLFRWRWVDEDIAVMMFPDRAAKIRAAVEEATQRTGGAFEEESWYDAIDPFGGTNRSGVIYAHGSGMTVDAKRRKVRLIECQYRKPATVKVVDSGPMQGAIFDERDDVMAGNLAASKATLVDRTMLVMHVAVFTETDMLGYGRSLYRHGSFSLTPVWCYRRNRDRMPYGVIRRVRDIQQDLNKRASKALFMLNTNQMIMDEGAVEDIDVARDEVSRPDGVIVKKTGKDFLIRRDTDAATGQLSMMALDAQSIQKSAGVADENLGRQTNAVSGAAIKARQIQGSVVTTEPFDNLRLATQLQGEKQLSLSEQFYTEQKVIRLVGNKGALEWVKLNQPEQQPDGSVRYLNDITASQADFMVSEQDYSGALRQVMFDSLNQIAGRLPPDVSMRLLTMAYEFSDLPNKDEVADQFRKLTGERDPNKEMTPEEQQQEMQSKQMQAEALQMQRETALLAVEEQRAKVRELNAKAAKMEADAMAAGGDMGAQVGQAHAQAAAELDRVSEELRRAQAQLANEAFKINKDADVRTEVARIEASSRERVAEIQAASDERLARIEAVLSQAMARTQGVASMADSSPKTKTATQE